MQENNKELTSLGLRSYYQSLSRKEKVKLKNYISQKLVLSYFSVYSKFRGSSHFSVAELIAIQHILEGDEWKQ